MKMNTTKIVLFSVTGLAVLVVTLLLIFRSPSADLDPLAAEAEAGYQVATVYVTDEGFSPDHIELQAGKPAKINFKKPSKLTCIKSLVTRELDLDVPLSKGDNIVTLTDLKPGEYRYHCGMYMYYATISVKG
ncbi:cupredoxin domain-containing protein [Paenibacillus whitsoniae]|uniref:Cupredoxin domain-containing protein n=1 Tax=Paenibacillus whitsoniae TaxID=2496558 RepID=A0A3S0CXG4_9BACL|nr:cupredoxin domain-containing protein [Paenibacillus whitsoniae]RTE11002.1 cupredoxin domain-containing protein [Paenibacillus whitsoniae]